MIPERSQSIDCPPHLLVQDRCRVLGVPTWRFDADGARLSGPTDAGHAGAWLRSAPVERTVADSVKTWREGGAPGIAACADGFSLIPVVESQRRRRRAFIAAAVLGPELLCSEWLSEVCEAESMDCPTVRAALSALAVFPGAVVERIAVCLGWSQADLETIALDNASIAAFTLRLAESYEAVTLLQTLGRSMNQLAHPQKFVALACEELQKTLPYEWIGVRFAADRRLTRAMAGRLKLCGQPPCPMPQLQDETARLLGELPLDKERVLLPEDHSPLAPGHSQLLIYPVVRESTVVAAVFAGGKKGDDQNVSSPDIKLLEAAAAYLTILLDNAVLYDDQQLMFVGTLEALTSSIDAKDPYTCGHSERVAELAAALAAAHGLSDEAVERIRISGIVHDVGKIGVPEAVLCKTGRLTEQEFALIKEHPEIGYQILRDIPLFEDLLPGVLYHHERFDGRGYPKKLMGNDIPLMARIIGLVDAFDAMSSNRTYRAAMPRERVLEELNDNAGTQFDPELVESFVKVDLARYDELVEKHQAESNSGDRSMRFRRGASAPDLGGIAA